MPASHIDIYNCRCFIWRLLNKTKKSLKSQKSFKQLIIPENNLFHVAGSVNLYYWVAFEWPHQTPTVFQPNEHLDFTFAARSRLPKQLFISSCEVVVKEQLSIRRAPWKKTQFHLNRHPRLLFPHRHKPNKHRGRQVPFAGGTMIGNDVWCLKFSKTQKSFPIYRRNTCIILSSRSSG